MKKVLLSFSMVAMTLCALSQKKGIVRLTHGEFTFKSNAHEPSIWKEKKSEAVDGKIYRLVLFESVPERPVLEILKANGIEMLEYVPRNGYIVSIETKSRIERLFEYGAVCVLPIPYELKVSREIYLNELPEYTFLNEELLRVIIVPFRNLSISRLLREADRYIQRNLNVDDLNNLAEVVTHKSNIQSLASLPGVMYVQQAEPPGEPENNRARENHRVQNINYGRLTPSGFTGEGVVVGIGDDGAIGPHADYKGRLQQPFATSSTGNHGDHVAGTVFGAGNVNPSGMGMAPGAEVFYRTYPENLQNILSDYSQYNVRITNSSYSDGCNSGYTNNARNMDIQTRQLSSLLHVFSAGNSGTQNCNFISGWGNITGGHKQAKNVIAVGNISALDSINSSSSRGPARDGRVKPEVVANGTSVFSTVDPHTYATFTGTSMASPGTAGTLATIYHAYRSLHNQDPKSALIKAHLLNTADDLGNRGPDFRYGFGRINARRAIQAIENNYHYSDTISQNQSKTFTLEVPSNVAQLKIMLYYHDREALANAQSALVNDLDMSVSFGSSTFLPLVLNPAPNVVALTSAAVPGIDSVNNVEQIIIDTPTQGLYTITIYGKNVPFPAQEFFVVYDFITNTPILAYPNGAEISWEPASLQTIRWEAPAGAQTFQLHISPDSGTTWIPINTNIGANVRRIQWNVPSNFFGRYWIRLTRGSQQVVSLYPVHIIGTPQNITINRACPDTVTLTWNAVPNASGYYITRLGQKYMEIYDTVFGQNTTIAHLTGLDFNGEEWLSVMAYGANGVIGNRGVAAMKAPGLFNCVVQKDLALQDVFNLPNGHIPSCSATDSIQPVMRIHNAATDAITSAVVSVWADSQLLVSDTLTTGLPLPGSTVDYTFSKKILLPNQPSVLLRAEVKAANDQNSLNDTLLFISGVYTATTTPISFTTDFDTISLCNINADCEQTVCPIPSWVNLDNGTQDFIDWRVHTGNTPTTNTGPPGDYNLNGNGRYIYLEATGCADRTAILSSQCFPVTGLTLPELSFWYHMWGAAMGSLQVDILDSNRWTTVWQRSGNQGNSWQNARISLVPYLGKTIAVRFVGTTGGNTSDIALDMIEVRQNTQPPIPDFTPSATTTCPSTPVVLNDNTTGTPTQWQWSISPATFTMVGNSTLTDQNPVVAFTQTGSYTISLVVSNPNGSDSITKQNIVNVTAGQAPPFSQNFQPLIFPPAGWTVDNPDNGITWERQSPTPHNTGNASASMYFFNYPLTGEKDFLNLPLLSLFNLTQPALLFDVAYAQYPSFSDSLAVEAAVGCVSQNYVTLYQKGGSQLATASATVAPFTPTPSQWRTDTVLLTPYANNPIRLRFKSINGYGNNLYITNVRLVDLAIQPPVAGFTIQTPASGSTICIGDTVTFADNSQNNPTNYSWNFGNGASPAFANTPGPHKVIYVNGGQKTITLNVLNQSGSSSSSQSINVFLNPGAFQNLTVNADTLFYTANISGSYDSLLWDFGDGNNSTNLSGFHQYKTNGIFTVSLTLYHSCGNSVFNSQITISGIGTEEWNEHMFKIFPNPNQGEFTLILHPYFASERLQIVDITGRVVYSTPTDNQKKILLNLSELPNGTYILIATNNKGLKIQKPLIISK
ncbi:MAG: S8 family serine peptidase [Thermaurantimonas sp.]